MTNFDLLSLQERFLIFYKPAVKSGERCGHGPLVICVIPKLGLHCCKNTSNALVYIHKRPHPVVFSPTIRQDFVEGYPASSKKNLIAAIRIHQDGWEVW